MKTSRLALLFCLPLAISALAQADMVRLRSGGELRGDLLTDPIPVRPTGTAPDETLTVRTLTGATVTVRRADVITVVRRSPLIEEHHTLAAAAPDTTTAQWELAEWSRERRLTDERQVHLERMVELDPDHADARAALGHVRQGGEWMERDEAMRRRGLVEYRGRWITPQEFDLIERTAAERGREQDWFKEVRLAATRLRSADPDQRRQAAAALAQITDTDAVPALVRFFRDDADSDVRRLMVAVLGQLPGTKPVAPLVTQSLHDVDRGVRHAALDAVGDERLGDALPLYLQGLRNDSNEIVRRAGLGLEHVGDRRAVPDLIKSLVTTHRYKVRVPDRSGAMSFSTAGTYGPGGTPLPPDIAAGLATGQYPNGVIVVDPAAAQNVRWRTVTVRVNHENPEILAALRTLTGQDFGYDELAWTRWLALNKNGG